MSFDFGNGPNGYINYKVYQDSRKGGDGGRKPSSNSGCLTSIISVLVFIIIVAALFTF